MNLLQPNCWPPPNQTISMGKIAVLFAGLFGAFTAVWSLTAVMEQSRALVQHQAETCELASRAQHTCDPLCIDSSLGAY